MQHQHLQFGHGFKIVLGSDKSQAAEMTLAPGESEGGPNNNHQAADQWLFVMSGSGVAFIDGVRVELGHGTLVFIERGEKHEIRNTGSTPLKTVNIYVPPAYTTEGDELPAGRSG